MNHVIVERKDHERGIGDDAAENARIHRVIVGRLRMNGRSQARGGFIRIERRRPIGFRHTQTSTKTRAASSLAGRKESRNARPARGERKASPDAYATRGPSVT